MPTITQQTVEGYAHCRDSLCPGNEQELVHAVRELSELYYKEWDPDGVPGVMNSTVRFMFADPGDVACPHCGQNREVTDQERPVYPVMTSQLDGVKTTDQRFLLELQKKGLILAPGEQLQNGGGESSEVAELRRQVAELTGMLNGFVAGQRTQHNPAGPADGDDTVGDTAAPAKRRRRTQGEEPTP